MPKAKLTTNSGARKTNSKKTVKVIAQRASRKNPSAPPLAPTIAAFKFPPDYPWDSHQDDIVVNSVEIPTQQLAGAQHYLHQLSLKKDYKKICTDFDEYRCLGSTKPGLSDIDDEEQDGIEQEQHTHSTRTNYSKAPNPPPSSTAYEYQIYTCTTTNPAIFLAITRIAQRNLPFINFRSALNHLPNLLPTKRLPKLQFGVLTENILHEECAGSDRPVTVLFFPHFYHDGRDAVGYYVPSAPARRSSVSGNRQTDVQDTKHMLFTPCTLNELKMYGLITFAYRDRTQEGVEIREETNGRELVQSVGVKGGRWIGADFVEEWEEFRKAFTMVAEVWQKRLDITGFKDLL
ncbi:uncharacterized protein yc1106_05922 [Curvularia clavata]|uniref:Uncharacterized protein n=1 Tax=Curvularia clavata TaxID=95742 RepID=A0A9Q8ZEA4_CURCL|nr:uncharacterized protein yc1106_05922 [Curvularia clavata]